MPKDQHWRLAGTVLDGHDGPEETHTYGGSYTLTAWLTSDSDSGTGEWPDYIDRYRDLRGYQSHAGQYAIHELSSGHVAYTETHTGPGSLLVALRPPVDSETALGGYYLVDEVAGLTTLPSALCQLDIGLTFVAPLSAYPDRDAARDALEAPI